MVTMSQQLVEFICAADLDKIPRFVVERVKQTVIDHLTVTGAVSGVKTTAPVVTFVNGTQAHALYYGDLKQNLDAHPTALARAGGETNGTSGGYSSELYPGSRNRSRIWSNNH